MLGNSATHGSSAVCGGSSQHIAEDDGTKRKRSVKYGYHHPTYMPNAKSSSSNRIRASSVVSTVKLNGKRGSTRRRSNKRAHKKSKKQCQYLVDVPRVDTLSLSQEVIDSNIVFGDGGQRSNPPISPVIKAENNIKKKPIIILSIVDGKLSTPHQHMNDPSRGLISRSNSDEVNFLLIPRKDAIASFVGKPSLSINICRAIDAVESVTRSTQMRGQANHVMVEDPRNKYICTGNQTNRAGPGIRAMHYSLNLVNKEHSSHLMKVFTIIENLFDAWMDTGVIRLIRAALDLVNANTFTVQLPSQPGEDQPRFKSSRIYGAFASGINTYLNAHTDRDFIFGAVTIHMEEEYTLGQRVVAYFLFPRLGIAVPLRPGDVLFFNPQEPHCISSRVDNNDKIYCVSLYLKSDNLGLNDNSKPLTKDQEYYLGKYEMSHRI